MSKENKKIKLEKRTKNDTVVTEWGEKYFGGKYYINDNGYFAAEEDISADGYEHEKGIAVGTDLQTIDEDGKIRYYVAYEGYWKSRETGR